MKVQIKNRKIYDEHMTALRRSLDGVPIEEYDIQTWQCRSFLIDVVTENGATEGVRNDAENAAMDLISKLMALGSKNYYVNRMIAAAEYVLALTWSPKSVYSEYKPESKTISHQEFLEGTYSLQPEKSFTEIVSEAIKLARKDRESVSKKLMVPLETTTAKEEEKADGCHIAV